MLMVILCCISLKKCLKSDGGFDWKLVSDPIGL